MTDRRLSTAQAYLAAQARARDGSAPGSRGPAPGLFVTISRQAGAGGPPVAEALARLLTEREVGQSNMPWTVFDQEILHKIVEKNDFPPSLVKDLETQGVTPLEGILTDLFGVWPSAYDLLSKTSQMILQLAHLGNAIVIGRAGNVVTRHLDGSLHVRLVGSFWRRLRRIRERDDLEPYEAEKRLEKIDEGRRNYLKRYFEKDIDDPTLYDTVLNTDQLGYEGAAEVIAEALRAKTSAREKAP